MAGSAYEEMLLAATRRVGVATLAAGMIVASARQHSPDEAAELFRELERAMYPDVLGDLSAGERRGVDIRARSPQPDQS